MSSNSKLTMQNNPVARRKRRYRTLRYRACVISQYMRSARVEYGKNGVAAALYPNLDPRRNQAQQLHRKIKKEMDEIAQWLHKYGYALA